MTEVVDQPSITTKLDGFFETYCPIVECSQNNIAEKWSNALRHNFKKATLPRNFTHHPFQIPNENKIVDCFRSDAKKPWLEIRFILGLKSVPFPYERPIRFLNAIGISVSTMVLPISAKDSDFMPICMAATDEYLFNENLDVHKKSKPGILKMLLAHSTGGLCSELHITDPQKDEQASKIFKAGAILMAPFFAISNANEMFARLNCQIFTKQASKHPDKYTSQTLGGKIFAISQKLIGEPQIFSSIGEPTYQQAIHLSAYGKKLWENLNSDKKQKRKLKRYFIIPKYDNVACPKILEFFSKRTGAKYIPIKNWHNPLLETPLRTLQKIIKRAVKQAIKLEVTPSQYAQDFCTVRNKTLRDNFNCGHLHRVITNIFSTMELNSQWLSASARKLRHSSAKLTSNSQVFMDQRIPALTEVASRLPQLIS